MMHEGFAARDFVQANLLGWNYLDGIAMSIENIDLAILWNVLCYFDEGEIDHILTELFLQLNSFARVLVSEAKGYKVRVEDNCNYRPFYFYENAFKRAGFEIARHVDHDGVDITNEKTGGVLEIPKCRTWMLEKGTENESIIESEPEKFQKSNTGNAILIERGSSYIEPIEPYV